MSKVAAVGEKDVLLCFKAVGVEIFPVVKSDECLSKIKELAPDPTYGIILVTESLAKNITEEISHLIQKYTNTILIIPNHSGSLNTSLLEIKKLIERAVGIDLISKEDV